MLLDVAATEVLTKFGRAPHGDDGERCAVGKVESFDSQHLVGAEHQRDARRRSAKRELEHLSFGLDAALLELTLDRAQLAQVLPQWFAGDVPAEALASIDQAFVAEDLEGASNRDAADAELGRELALAGQHLPDADRRDPRAQDVGDLLIADRSHGDPSVSVAASLRAVTP